MTYISPLNEVHKKGLYGDYEEKSEKDLIKISDIKNNSIFQIVKYDKTDNALENLSVDGLKFPDRVLQVESNGNTRILWQSPLNWLVISKKKQNELMKELKKFESTTYAITDLTHSRTCIELEGSNVFEVLKKGCPFNISELKTNNSVNSIFNGITITIDVLDEKNEKVRIYSLRSFGESLYHSVTDASLEFGYKNI